MIALAGTSKILESESAVNRELDPTTRQQLGQVPGWRGLNNPWLPDDDDQAVDFSYVNLLENPERYTGYKVQPASWTNIATDDVMSHVTWT